MMKKALEGNVRAFEQISKLTTTDVKDKHDITEQKARIKAIELENKKRALAIENGYYDGQPVVFIDDIGGTDED